MNTLQSNPPSVTTRHTGIVKWFLGSQGYGFIEISTALKQELRMPLVADLYVHVSGVRQKRELLPGDTVEFSIQESQRGPRAVDVVVTATQRAAEYPKPD